MDGRVICPHCSTWNIAGVDTCAQCNQSLADVQLTRKPQSRVEENLLRDRLQALGPVPPVVVGPDTPVCEVLDRLVTEKIGCVLVMENEQLLGIFSERDALLKLNADTAQLADRPVSEFMTPSVETLEFDDSIVFALHKMDLGGFRHIPLYRDGNVAGIVSVRDFLRYLVDDLIATT